MLPNLPAPEMTLLFLLSCFAGLTSRSPLTARCLKAARMVSLTFVSRAAQLLAGLWGVRQNLCPVCPPAPRLCSEPPATALGPLLFLIQASLCITGEWRVCICMMLCHSFPAQNLSVAAMAPGATFSFLGLDKPCLVIPITRLTTFQLLVPSF